MIFSYGAFKLSYDSPSFSSDYMASTETIMVNQLNGGKSSMGMSSIHQHSISQLKVVRVISLCGYWKSMILFSRKKTEKGLYWARRHRSNCVYCGETLRIISFCTDWNEIAWFRLHNLIPFNKQVIAFFLKQIYRKHIELPSSR